MRILAVLAVCLLALLSLAAGGVKLAQVPQEVQFFSSLGLDAFWLYPLGALQVLGAIGCVSASSRKTGMGIIALGFAISAAMIFASGNAAFGAVSLVPAALAAWLCAKLPSGSASAS